MLSGGMEQTAGLLALGIARTLPLTWSIPAFGGPSLPVQLRLAIGVGLAVFSFPILDGSAPVDGALAFALLAAREVLVGVVMGLVVACMFRAAEVAGELTDILRGAATELSSSPAGEHRTSPLGALMLLFASVVFLEIGGVGHVVAALARSYEAFPLGPAALGGQTRTAALLATVAAGKLIEAAVGLAAPAMVALLLTDMVFGVIGRAVPRLGIQSIGTMTKALVGLGVVLVGLGSMDLAMQRGFHGFLELLGAVSGAGR
jgi:flagellar biosynthesis protein FliR